MFYFFWVQMYVHDYFIFFWFFVVKYFFVCLSFCVYMPVYVCEVCLSKSFYLCLSYW